MKTKHKAKSSNKNRRNLIRPISSLFIAIAILSIGLYSIQRAHAATAPGTLYITPSSGSYTVGQTVTIDIRENSGSTSINAAEADISYPNNLLTYDTYSVSSSSFNYPGPPPSITTGSNNLSTFKYAILDTGTLTSDADIVKVTFTVTNPGTANIAFLSTAEIVSDGTNTNATATGASLALTAPSSGGGSTGNGGGTGSTGNTGSTGSTNTNSASTTNKPAAAPTNSVYSPPATGIQTTGTNSGQVNLPSGSSVQVSQPVTIQTSQGSSIGQIVKVEYYIGNKLLKTDTTAPFSLRLDTTNLLNGTYNLTTKTYYASGKVITTQQKIMVKNKFGLTQLNLAAQRYGLAIAIICIFIALFTYFYIFRGPVGHILGKRQLANDMAEGIVVGGGEPVKLSEPPKVVKVDLNDTKVEDDEVKIITPTEVNKDKEL